MELKEFISNTLSQLADGVQNAIQQSEGRNYAVNPTTTKTGSPYTIHFDLSVETGKEGTADIKILNGTVSERSCNRIMFDVSMTYPASVISSSPHRPAF